MSNDYKCPHCHSCRDTWFDRSFMLDSDGNEIKYEGPCYRCQNCGKNVNAPPEHYNPNVAFPSGKTAAPAKTSK